VKLRPILCVFFATAGIFALAFAHADVVLTSKPAYSPDYSHEGEHLTDATLAWDALMKSTNVMEGAANAHFVFNFTNVSGSNVVILDARPSCYCTSAELPPVPWFLPPGTNAHIGINVNLAGKYGTVVKQVRIGTDRGTCNLIVEITIIPKSTTPPTDAERIRQMQIAKVDRQAVFKNDCASCHEKPGEFKYGKALYDADCAICHEDAHRASMVPDLHALKVPTNDDFWRTWISHGKPGTFMPAFSSAEGGPLNDMQISSLASYLDSVIPSRPAQLQ
jgi:mono/diheme cytochrome c family protein